MAKVVVAVALLVGTLAVAKTVKLVPHDLLERIDTKGARRVLQHLWDNEDEFGQVCSGVESGDSSWLEVARRLRPAADASLALGLDYAVARALPTKPVAVLKLIQRGFPIDTVCTSPFIEPDPGVAERYQRRAAAALRRAVPPNLEAVRVDCLKRVELPLASE